MRGSTYIEEGSTYVAIIVLRMELRRVRVVDVMERGREEEEGLTSYWDWGRLLMAMRL